MGYRVGDHIDTVLDGIRFHGYVKNDMIKVGLDAFFSGISFHRVDGPAIEWACTKAAGHNYSWYVNGMRALCAESYFTMLTEDQVTMFKLKYGCWFV
jgi:hypothetical protein